MPPINDYKCNLCDFELPQGWGGYMYVEDSDGRRIVCPHPCEESTVLSVTGRKRTGFNSYCVCLDCLCQFEADLGDEKVNEWRYFYRGYFKVQDGIDKRECPKCHSGNVKTVFEIIGETCPKCKIGKIEEIETGWIS